MAAKDSMIGKQINSWTVLEKIEKGKGVIFYRCVCVCDTEKEVAAISLRNGHSKSCGCVKSEPKAAKEDVTPPEATEALSLISEGFLPAADQIGLTGSPAWTVESIARIFGIDRNRLIKEIKASGSRFGDEGKQKKEPAQGWAVS